MSHYSLLDEAQKSLSAAVLGDLGNRAEAKSWLIATIANQQHVPAETRLACFIPLSSSSSQPHSSRDYDRSLSSSRSRDSKARVSIYNQQIPGPLQSSKAATMQLLQLIIDTQSQAIAQLLLQDPDFLCDYLTSSVAIINSWFGQFSISGIQHFKFGARALANYALTHRSEMWEHLVWRGKHDQAPVAVAAKPHYFAELDAPKTLRNLARYCPGFWCGDELFRSCEGGEWLKLNPGMVAEELHHLLLSPESSRHHQLLQLVTSFIQAADWAVLCNRLLLLLEEQQLLNFMRLLAQQQQQQQQRRSKGHLPFLVQQWVDKQVDYNRQKLAVCAAASNPAAAAAAQLPCVANLHLLMLAQAPVCGIDQLLLTNALTCHRSQLLALLKRDDDGGGGAGHHLLKLAAVAQQLFDPSQQQQQEKEGDLVAAAASVVVPSAEVSSTLQRLLQQSLSENKPQHIMLVGWLLWLHLLLAFAAGQSQWQQALGQLGCSCHPAPYSGERRQTDELQKDHHQQTGSREQHHQRQGHQHGHQQLQAGSSAQQQDLVQQQLKQAQTEKLEQQQQQQGDGSESKPLRRGLPAAKAAHKLAVKEHRAIRLKHGRRNRHKGKRGMLGKRKRRDTTTTTTSSSSSSGTGSDSRGISGTTSEAESDTPRSVSRSTRKRKKGKHKRKKRQRTSSSRSSRSEWEEGSEIDYDAGGELLDPADFQQQQQQQPATALPRAEVLTVGSSSSGLAAAANKPTAQQQQQQQQQLVRVLDALDSLSRGRGSSAAGMLVELPISQAAGTQPGAVGSAKPACIRVTGPAAEIANVVAWYCVCSGL